MKLSTVLAGTTLAAIVIAGDAALPTGLPRMPGAEAAARVSFSLFYDELSRHGSWVRYHDAYVFIPAHVGRDWRPYTIGHWVFTGRYGWLWMSDEPFGWATYHYGRWGYSRQIGWYWVPGRRWAPAWVSWRRSADYVVWAPLPPRRGADVDISVSISAGDIPDFYWVAVPTRRFLAPDIHVVVVNEDRRIREVVQRTEFVGAPRIANNIVVNNAIDVNVISRETGKKVPTVTVQDAGAPGKAKVNGAQISVFQGDVAPDAAAKPGTLRDTGKVKPVKTPAATTDVGEVGEVGGAPAAPANAGSNTSTQGQDNAATPPVQPAMPGKDQAAKPKPEVTTTGKATSGAAAGQPTAEAPATNATEVPQGKKRKPGQTQDQGGGGAGPSAAPAAGTGTNATGTGGSNNATTPEPVPGNGTDKSKKDKKACDPAADVNCPPAP